MQLCLTVAGSDVATACATLNNEPHHFVGFCLSDPTERSGTENRVVLRCPVRPKGCLGTIFLSSSEEPTSRCEFDRCKFDTGSSTGTFRYGVC